MTEHEVESAASPRGSRDGTSELPSSITFDGEDFLFHLYRGSELLQDNCVAEAKEELERALSMQPRDVEGQGLLGVVYFRLGLYPRAIQIYEELVRACPDEITPKINVALCYLKTGQLSQSREALEDVLRRVPDHKRAWGYLGLVFERLGDPAKALASFERAGQEPMARRMQRLLDADADVAPPSNPAEHAEVRRAASDAMDGLEGETRGFSAAGSDAEPAPSRSGRWRAIEPGEDRMPPAHLPRVPQLSMSAAAPTAPAEPARPAVVRSPSSLARDVRLDAAAGGAASPTPATLVVRVERAFHVRASAVRALSPEQDGFVSAAVQRHARGRDLDEPLGGAGSPIARLEGTGLAVLGAAGERHVTAVRLADELLYMREDCVIGFDAALHFENGRLPATNGDPTAIVQLGGVGLVVFESHRLCSLDVATGRPVLARARDVLGWIGRLLPQPVATADAPGGAHGFVTFSGEGVLLLDA